MIVYLSMLTGIAKEGLIHVATMFPVLVAVFLLVETISHRTHAPWLSQGLAHPFLGPLVGAGLGLLPQCGFSIAATSLFVEGLIPTGSLLASYIATSDEAIPILLGDAGTRPWVAPLLGTKLIWGLFVGVAVNLISRKIGSTNIKSRKDTQDTHDTQDTYDTQDSGSAHGTKDIGSTEDTKNAKDTQNTGNSGHHEEKTEKLGSVDIWRRTLPHALGRAVRVATLVFVLSLAFNLAGHLLGDRLGVPGASSGTLHLPLASVVGLFPSCATSVALSEAFGSGVISFPALVSGLTANAGMGLLVLMKECKDRSRTFGVIVLLVLSAMASGALVSLFVP